LNHRFCDFIQIAFSDGQEAGIDLEVPYNH